MSSSSTMKAAFALVALLSFAASPVFSYYSNVTLTSDDLSVIVYLPAGTSSDNDGDKGDVFYRSSRFEHGSMIGSIQRTTQKVSITTSPKTGVSEKHNLVETTELYGTELWRVPHNPYWPESGVGLASEFGVGDDGANCDYRCGWNGVDDVTNGVLGYKEAAWGQSFLKIGVGELIKGSCDSCDWTGEYNFNSPYQFAKPPVWKLEQTSPDTLLLKHEAKVNQYGYRLEKNIALKDDVLSVTSTLTNLGVNAFRTAWYSHHFFDCNAEPIGPGYSVELDLKESRPQLLEEPGLSGWTMPLRNYAKVQQLDDHVQVSLKRYIDEGTRIKAEFLKDSDSTGSFTLKGCGTFVKEDLQMNYDDSSEPVSMYGFNLYMERSTLSPEPQILIHLASGASASWTQRIVIQDDVEQEQEEWRPPSLFRWNFLRASVVSSQNHDTSHVGGSTTVLVIAVVCFSVAVAFVRWRRDPRRYLYTRIQDC